jgi:hypothetical protein
VAWLTGTPVSPFSLYLSFSPPSLSLSSQFGGEVEKRERDKSRKRRGQSKDEEKRTEIRTRAREEQKIWNFQNIFLLNVPAKYDSEDSGIEKRKLSQ